MTVVWTVFMQLFVVPEAEVLITTEVTFGMLAFLILNVVLMSGRCMLHGRTGSGVDRHELEKKTLSDRFFRPRLADRGGILFQIGLGTGFHALFSSVNDRSNRAAQWVSNSQARAMESVRHGSRSEYLEPLQPTLESAEALRHPDKILFGAYDGGFPTSSRASISWRTRSATSSRSSRSTSLGVTSRTNSFPTRMVETIHRMGSVPMITWEPWMVDFDESARPNLAPAAEREYASLAAIARGEYDFYIVPFARAAAAYDHPLFLRFAHEMNDPYRYPWGPQNGNRPEDFVAAWRHVHQIFQKMGAEKVLWVWSPHISMAWFEYYYPGDPYVDWVGIGVLNYGTVATWSRWWSFNQILEKSYPTLQRMGKPIMICEFGTLEEGGDAPEWYRQAFYQIDHTFRRGIRAVVLFNQTNDITISPDYPLNWSVLQNPRSMELMAGELARESAL